MNLTSQNEMRDQVGVWLTRTTWVVLPIHSQKTKQKEEKGHSCSLLTVSSIYAGTYT
jgi:hypothetical protein